MDLREANKARILFDGSTYTERVMNVTAESISGDFEYSPSYFTVQNFGTKEYLGVQILGSSNALNIDSGKVILMKPYVDLKTGEMFILNGVTWLTIDVDNISRPSKKGRIVDTDNVLRYMNDQGSVSELPCVASTRIYIGSSQDKLMVLPENRIRVYCSSLYNGLDIQEGMRFILGRKAYVIVSINDLTTGILDLLMERDDIEKGKDNLDTGIASNQGDPIVETDEDTSVSPVIKPLW
jgi:hypothetical protein